MTLTIIKFICLLIGIWFSIVNMGRTKYKQDISISNTLMD